MSMRQLGGLTVVIIAAAMAADRARAEDVLMSGHWGQDACAAWNENAILTSGLAESGWVNNDAGRGFKVLQLYRSDCFDSPTVELRIGLDDGRAMCQYGGAPQTAALDTKVDYVMHAETRRWLEMGAGKYGPMKAMMLRRLKFKGPRWEAMKNMGPFSSFLRLVGKVGGDATACGR